MTLVAPTVPPETVASRVVLPRVSWQTYERLLEEVGDGPLRLTFDRGRLEIEVPSVEHERLKKFLGRLVEAYALEAGIDVLPLGSATWRRQAEAGGLEADECYYVNHYAAVVHKSEIDLAIDPPPDLALEVELSNPSVDKQPVYARLGIPELWRLHAGGLEILHLESDGAYAPAPRSLTFPQLPPDVLIEWLAARQRVGEARAVREFRDWVIAQFRQQSAGGGATTP